MSNWQFEDMGDFGDDAAADRWARRNNVDPRDVRISRRGDGVRLEIRRSALGDSGPANNDLRDGRRKGW